MFAHSEAFVYRVCLAAILFLASGVAAGPPLSATPVDTYGDDYGGRLEMLTSSTVIVAVIVHRSPIVVLIAVDVSPLQQTIVQNLPDASR